MVDRVFEVKAKTLEIPLWRPVAESSEVIQERQNGEMQRTAQLSKQTKGNGNGKGKTQTQGTGKGENKDKLKSTKGTGRDKA